MVKRNKKVCIMTWEMLETGGIIRVIMGYQTGFEKLGWDTVTYLGNKNGRLKVSENEFTLMTKWFRPKAKNLGWHNKEQMKEFRKVIKGCDMLLSIHGCPHPTKSGAIGDYEWQDIYKIARKENVPIGIVITDNLWDRFYPWITDVIDNNTHIFYNNWNAGFDSIAKLKKKVKPAQITFIDYPIDIREQQERKKIVDVAWVPQWKKWKGIYEFIEALSHSPDKFKTALFNTGIEYYNIRKLDYWKKAINRDYFLSKREGKDIQYNEKSNVNFYGIINPDRVGLIYATSKVSLDLSGAFSKKFEAQFTCAMAEAMMHKSLMAVSPQIWKDEKSRIQGLPIAYPIDKNNIVESLEEIVNDNKKRNVIISNAYDWVQENCADDMVSQKIAEYMGVA